MIVVMLDVVLRCLFGPHQAAIEKDGNLCGADGASPVYEMRVR
jgi:hypothetical protein